MHSSVDREKNVRLHFDRRDGDVSVGARRFLGEKRVSRSIRLLAQSRRDAAMASIRIQRTQTSLHVYLQIQTRQQNGVRKRERERERERKKERDRNRRRAAYLLSHKLNRKSLQVRSLGRTDGVLVSRIQ